MNSCISQILLRAPTLHKSPEGEKQLLFNLSFANTPAYFQQAPLHSRADVVLGWLTNGAEPINPSNKSCQPIEKCDLNELEKGHVTPFFLKRRES